MINSIWDWIIVIAVVLILFGSYNKIPELFRALGRAVGEFRKGQVEVERELNQLTKESSLNQANQANVSKQDNIVKAKDEEIEELRRQVEELKRKLEEMEKGKKPQ